MTWTKTGTEFPDDIAAAGLSDAAYRTHHEAITWVYRVERDDLRVPKHLLRRVAGSDDWEIASTELVAAGYWQDDGDAWVIVHHADVVRQSLTAQIRRRERNRRNVRAHRARRRSRARADVSDDVSAYASDDVTPFAVSQSVTVGALSTGEQYSPT